MKARTNLKRVSLGGYVNFYTGVVGKVVEIQETRIKVKIPLSGGVSLLTWCDK